MMKKMVEKMLMLSIKILRFLMYFWGIRNIETTFWEEFRNYMGVFSWEYGYFIFSCEEYDRSNIVDI